MAIDASREFLRHTVATLAYRGGKAISVAGDSVANFPASETTRTPLEILAHVGDLLDWAIGLTQGQYKFHEANPESWEEQVDRFFAAIKKLDDALASDTPLGFPPEQIFQGPIADALTHVGQIALLRRAAGSPMRGENYFKAHIEAGRVGAEQSTDRIEFD